MPLSVNVVSKYVAKPATAFAAGAVIGGYMRPDLYVPIFGMRVPAWALTGLVCAVGCEASALANDYVFPHITQLSIIDSPIETAAAIGVNAAAGALAYNFLVPGSVGEIGLTELVAGSAAVELLSGYITKMWIEPALNQWM